MQALIHTPSAEGFSAVCSEEVARLHSQPISISLWLHFLRLLTAISVMVHHLYCRSFWKVYV